MSDLIHPAALRLGVNIDHVATIRNARGGDQDQLTPDLLSSRIRDTVSGANGTNVIGSSRMASVPVGRLNDAGIRVSLFIAPEARQLEAAMRLKAPVVEFHTGEYAHATGEARAAELRKLADMAALAAKNGIEPHAGHGLTFDNVQAVAAIPQIAELNIGHFLIGEAIFTGLDASIRRMRDLMDAAR